MGLDDAVKARLKDMGQTFNKATGRTNLPKKLGEATGLVERPQAISAQYHVGMDTVGPSGRFWWSLVEPELPEFRVCTACDDLFIPAECSIHLSRYSYSERKHVLRPNPAWHVRCVTPDMWRVILGHPQGIPHKRDRGMAAPTRTWRNVLYASDQLTLFEPLASERVSTWDYEEATREMCEAIKTALQKAGPWSGEPHTFLRGLLEDL